MDGPEELLRRIVRSAAFRGSQEHGKLLEYICLRTLVGGPADLREHDIGVAVLNLEPGYDVTGNPLVGRMAEEVREKLKAYFRGEGRREPLRVALPKGEFRAFFYEADPRQIAEAAPGALDQFWAPYWRSGVTNLLIHGELEGEGMLIAEAYAAVQLAVLFEGRGAALRLQPASAFAESGVPEGNLVLVGTPATNAMLAGFVREPLEGAILQRIWARDGHGVVTILASPEPAGILPAARFVTSEEVLEEAAAASPLGEIPKDFRVTLG
ncbi:MAG: hypothetical protein IANPNBLG_04500 [Bryobacteraceae bacterium]|nr:hypothetical protein [Bryobacteraceae bacterium]